MSRITSEVRPPATGRRLAPGGVEARTATPPLDPPTPSSAHTSNPLRIGRIGADHIQVSIRPAFDDAEFAVLVDRVEQLIDAGYDTIDVVFEGSGGTDDAPHTTVADHPTDQEGPDLRVGRGSSV